MILQFTTYFSSNGLEIEINEPNKYNELDLHIIELGNFLFNKSIYHQEIKIFNNEIFYFVSIFIDEYDYLQKDYAIYQINSTGVNIYEFQINLIDQSFDPFFIEFDNRLFFGIKKFGEKWSFSLYEFIDSNWTSIFIDYSPINNVVAIDEEFGLIHFINSNSGVWKTYRIEDDEWINPPHQPSRGHRYGTAYNGHIYLMNWYEILVINYQTGGILENYDTEDIPNTVVNHKGDFFVQYQSWPSKFVSLKDNSARLEDKYFHYTATTGNNENEAFAFDINFGQLFTNAYFYDLSNNVYSGKIGGVMDWEYYSSNNPRAGAPILIISINQTVYALVIDSMDFESVILPPADVIQVNDQSQHSEQNSDESNKLDNDGINGLVTYFNFINTSLVVCFVIFFKRRIMKH
jgi:hypothetical protein